MIPDDSNGTAEDGFNIWSNESKRLNEGNVRATWTDSGLRLNIF